MKRTFFPPLFIRWCHGLRRRLRGHRLRSGLGGAWVYFNNDRFGHAIRDALELSSLLDSAHAVRDAGRPAAAALE